MKLVVDASVALMWVLGARPDELNVREADVVGEVIQLRGSGLYAPPHWIAEVLGVVARTEPASIKPAAVLMEELSPNVVSTITVHERAAQMAASLDHHLFDTLYHAVALEVGATLVTADERYFNKAHKIGSIVLLRDFTPPT